MTQKAALPFLIDFPNIPLGNSNDVFDEFKTIPKAIHRGFGFESFLFLRGI
ncbi:MAG: hypothetical protein HQK63_08755 [Desulfamplus sp.]|nr:hypothetical protein [Desulfamplus sp.]